MLDLTGNARALGKMPGDDLRNGRITLPFICALQGLSDDRADALRERLRSLASEDSDVSPAALEDLLILLRDCGALDRCTIAASRHAEQALEALDGVPEGAARAPLYALAESVAARGR